jgi:hypothetical protein
MSTLAVNTITNAAGGNTAQINGMTPTADSLQGFRNRIINGDMRIDQRNAGASVTIDANAIIYAVDRWYGRAQAADGVFTLQQDSSVPAGFTKSLKAIVTTADASIGSTQLYRIEQRIEGFNIADLGWGAASAQTVTLSFWVRSSLTGTFGGSVSNSAADRFYPFGFAISAANTWEYKTITITGDTSGTWLTDNGTGINISWSLGTGSDRLGTPGAWVSTQTQGVTGQTQLISTSGATFYITGVQLEAGSVATPFERRPYSTELQLCLRYYYKVAGDAYLTVGGWSSSTATMVTITPFPVQMRTRPSALEQTGTAANYRIVGGGSASTNCNVVPVYNANTSDFAAVTNFGVSSGLTAYNSGFGASNGVVAAYLAWSAEL